MQPFRLNDEDVCGLHQPTRLVLDWLREERGLTAAKDACREGECGACAVLLGTREPGDWVRYRLVNACLLPMQALEGHHLVTLEGLNRADGQLTPVQQALVDEGAIQCGFCTPGLVMALTHWLLNGRRFDRTEGLAAIGGNLCRCTGYQAIKRALTRLQPLGSALPPPHARLGALIAAGVLPASFIGVGERLASLPTPTPSAPRADALLVAGGTDLFAQARARHSRQLLVMLADRPELRGIQASAEHCHIGAATTVEELLESDLLAARVPHLHQVLERFGAAPVRGRATLGGNLVNASPIGDLSVCLLALDAQVRIKGPRGTRHLPLARFFLGDKRVDLHPGEWLTGVTLGLAPGPTHLHFEKVAHREHLDVAAVNSALALELNDGTIGRARLSAGGVGPAPRVLVATSDWLAGRTLNGATAWSAACRAQQEAEPIDDVRGSAAYKRRLLRQLVLAHFQALGPDGISAHWPLTPVTGGMAP
ncbi:MAG: molybdopterin dehydrogenase [Sphingobacteriia bacterium]|nr:molybdopterin dehydrogenase [Sphingobacteriia bacterium]NCC38822.1 molybdopterin dehydrogenase [Gammaproteobacteria bacterium]